MSELKFDDSNGPKLTEFMHEIHMKGYKFQFCFRILSTVGQKYFSTILALFIDGYLFTSSPFCFKANVFPILNTQETKCKIYMENTM